MRRLLFMMVLACAPAAAQPAADLLYVLERTATLPSSDTGWDYARMQPDSSRLFIARDKDGLTVFDVDTNKVVATVANSVGANGPLLLPEYDRGYVAMTDGSLLSFRLSTLAPITRVPLSSDGGLNSVVYDPGTRRIHAITGTRKGGATWYSFDAATGRPAGTTRFTFSKMDDPANNGRGTLYAPARQDRLILTLDSATLKETARWPVACTVSKVRYQPKTNRVLAACYGDDPRFLAIEASTGKTIANLPIARGIDALMIDERRGRIMTSGEDGTLTVIGYDERGGYRLLGSVTTRLGARMMAMDERNGRLLAVTADATVTPPDAKGESQTRYHPNSFTVLSYRPL